MAITTVDGLVNSMANNSSRLIIDKASVANTALGQFHSLWRGTGQPGQGAIPTAAASCDNTLIGAIQFTQQTSPATSYMSILESYCTNAGTTLEIHDRLAHMGGLSGVVTTAQTVSLDLDTFLATDNLAVRIGDTNYSDIQWWLEWYTDTGASNASVIVNVTYNDGTTGNLTSTGNLGTSRRATYLLQLNYLIPSAASGKFIRGVNNLTLSGTTGTAGNFGVTATRYRCGMYLPVANARFTNDWSSLGLPEIPNESCLFPIQLCSTTTTGLVRATGKISHG